MQIFFIKKKNQHRITMRMIKEMGREWEGIGRGIRSRPPLISPLTPHTMCVGGGGTLRDSALRSYSFLFTMKLKDGYVSIFKFHSKQKESRSLDSSYSSFARS